MSRTTLRAPHGDGRKRVYASMRLGRAGIPALASPHAGTSAKVAVEVEFPRDVLGDVDASQLSGELRRLWAVEQVRRRRLGVGKAAEVAGMPRAAFMQLLGEHEVPVIDYAVEDLQEELRSLSSG
jgi:predicted HTH domain antitoxin